MNRVHVRVPATTANIGPGFDCLGCALSLYAEFDCEEIPSGLEISGCAERYQNERNLFVQAFRRTEDILGVPTMPIRLHIRTDVPVSRGLGSSATLLAGGAAAANALHGGRLDRMKLLRLCAGMEGHPDNAAPALLGGMCVSVMDGNMPISMPASVSDRVGFIALIPNFETRTRDMRAVLPAQVPFADAVFNASRLAILLKAFEAGDLALIGKALDDRLHQPYRIPLIHEYDRARRAALDAGCAAFCVSGSGSTLLGVCAQAESGPIAERIRAILRESDYDWKILPLKMDREGTVCSR